MAKRGEGEYGGEGYRESENKVGGENGGEAGLSGKEREIKGGNEN